MCTRDEGVRSHVDQQSTNHRMGQSVMEVWLDVVGLLGDPTLPCNLGVPPVQEKLMTCLMTGSAGLHPT